MKFYSPIYSSSSVMFSPQAFLFRTIIRSAPVVYRVRSSNLQSLLRGLLHTDQYNLPQLLRPSVVKESLQALAHQFKLFLMRDNSVSSAFDANGHLSGARPDVPPAADSHSDSRSAPNHSSLHVHETPSEENLGPASNQEQLSATPSYTRDLAGSTFSWSAAPGAAQDSLWWLASRRIANTTADDRAQAANESSASNAG